MWSNDCQPVTLEATLSHDLTISERIDILLTLAHFYIHDITARVDAKSAGFIQQAEQLLAKQPAPTIQHTHLKFLISYKTLLLAQWETACVNFEQALSLYLTHGDIRGEFESRLKLAMAYAIMLNFEAAKTNLARCHQLVDELNDYDHGLIQFYHDAAIVCLWIGSLDLAESYANDCYQSGIQLPLYREEVIVKHNLRCQVISQWVLARRYNISGQHDRSLKCARQGLATLRTHDVHVTLWLAALVDEFSLALVALNRFDEAIDELTRILSPFSPKESILFASSYVELGKAYVHTKQYAKAEAALHHALDCYSKLQIRQYHEQGCLRALADLAKITGNHEQCIEYLEQLYQVSNNYWEDKHNHEMKLLAAANEYALKRQETEILRVSNEQLQTAYDEQSELVKLVVHDINNPLSVINLRTYMAAKSLAKETEEKETEENVEEAIKSFSEIGKLADYITTIVAQLQTMAKIDDGNNQLDCQAAALSDVLSQAVERNRPLAIAKQIDIVVDDVPSVAVWVDKVAIQQVFDNLLSNAIKYSWANSAVHIIVRHDMDDVRIDFVDNGVGLAPDELPKLFTKFGRLSSSRPTNKESSTGLGLYITRKLIRAMNGDVTATSDGLNTGTTFTICLPIYQT